MDHLTKEARSKNMRQIKSKDTSPELIVRKELFSKGLRYRIHNKKIPGKPDISISKYKVIIDVKGCFWHKHQDCKYSTTPKSNTEYWSKKIRANVERDKKTKVLQEEMGYKVFEIWECEAKSGEIIDQKVTKILNFISKEK